MYNDKISLKKKACCIYQLSLIPVFQLSKHGSYHHGAESHFDFCNKLLKKGKESFCSAVHDSGHKTNMLESGTIKSTIKALLSSAN
jgi:hypothetical protein